MFTCALSGIESHNETKIVVAGLLIVLGLLIYAIKLLRQIFLATRVRLAEIRQ